MTAVVVDNVTKVYGEGHTAVTADSLSAARRVLPVRLSYSTTAFIVLPSS